MIDLTPIIEALIALLAAIITAYAIPWLRNKLGTQKFDELKTWVGIAVEAAEKIFNETGMGEVKKQYVLSFLEEQGYIVDTDVIDALIESAVYNLKGE